MRKMCILLLLLIILIGCATAKLFFIGEPVDGNQLAIRTHQDQGKLHLYVTALDPAVALRDWKERPEKNILYLSVRKVPVYSLFSSEAYQTIIDTHSLEKIYLGGRQIWPSKK